jgi:hypothetical protein
MADRTVRWAVATCGAVCAPKNDDLKVQAAPETLGKGALKVTLCLQDVISWRKPPTISEPMYVCVNGEGVSSKSLCKYYLRCLRPYSWK